MKHIKIACLSLLLIAKAGIATAQTKADIPEQSSPTRSLSASVSSDSITWSKELEGIVVKAQKQLIKQEIDRIGYDVQADEERYTRTDTTTPVCRRTPRRRLSRCQPQW